MTTTPTALTTLLVAFALTTPAAADTASHFEAAKEFYTEARVGDAHTLSAIVTDMLVQLQPGLDKHREILAEFAREVVAGPSYEDARAAVYMEFFTEEELRSLTWLFRHQSYQKYRGSRVDLVRRSAEVTLDLFRAALPELQRRVAERAREGQQAGDR